MEYNHTWREKVLLRCFIFTG